MGEEILDIVDSNDVVIGKASRNEVYDKKLTHRIVHVFVINDNNEVYLQKRSDEVSYMPGAWCTSAGGHVLSGETYEQAARRELDEELGIKPNILFSVGSKFVFRIADQDRFIRVFVTLASDIPTQSNKEVSGGEFLAKEKAEQIIKSGEKIHPQLAPCFDLLLLDDQMISLA